MLNRTGSLLALACLLSATSVVNAAAPRFTQIQPRGVQRGQEVNVTLTGSNLNDAEDLMLYDQGMEVVRFQHPDKDDQKGKLLQVRLKVADDCPIGAQRMRIRTRTGLTEIQNLFVGVLPVVEEKEPNTDFATPQPITKNTSIHGRTDREDVDYFVIEAKQGERLTAEVFGTRFGNSGGSNYYDPYLAILNEDRFELAASDDTPLVWNDAIVSLIVPKDGKYIIQMRDAAYQGDSRSYYILSVGDFPRPQGVIPAGGKPGEKLTVTFVGDVLGPITREVTLPTEVQSPDRFGIDAQDERGIAPSTQPFRISTLDNVIEQEPNNDFKTATAAQAPAAFNGVIGEPGDIDFFKFAAKKDQQLNIQVYARQLRSPLDSVLNVYRATDGGSIGGNDDNRQPDSYYRFKAPADGEYVVAVRDHLKNGGDHYTYRIEVTPVSPSVTSEPIEFARYRQSNLEIPRGSGRGVVANVQRQDWGGPVTFNATDLPAGVRVECPEMWRGGGQMPVVFYAADDAPLAGHYASIITAAADPNVKATGPMQQKMLLTRGQNNDRVWEELITRIPVVVTEKLPYKVWIVPPTVPIVQGGSMNLAIKCERYDGFDGDIAVLLLQNPSGVNASTSAKIPKGQTETVINVNAASNAAVGEWQIATRCIATVGNGAIESCTEFVPLNVSERYVEFKFAQGAVNQGAETPYVVTVEKKKDFAGEAEVKLVGLPANATCEPLKLTQETKELIFTIKAAANTPTGMTKNMLCQVQVPEAGTTILHNLGSGVLRVDPPPPKPKDPAPTTEAKPAPVAKAAAKPLSRLEQLRLEQKEREAAGQ
ncbi:MAG: PPC domain-containing protein [Planctomycetaceae bacterium]